MQESTVINGIWAYLFANGKTEKIRYVQGEKIETGLSRKEVENMVRSFLGPTVQRITRAYDWDFVCAEATDAFVASTSEYSLSGDNDDCMDIINIRWGTSSSLEVLEKLNVLENDRRKGSETATGIYGWTAFGRSDDGFPLVQIHNTPTEANVFKYRYRKSGLTLSDIPADFDNVVIDDVLAQFDISLRPDANVSLKGMMDRYMVGGDEYETVRRDPVIEAGNIRRKGLQGGA